MQSHSTTKATLNTSKEATLNPQTSPTHQKKKKKSTLEDFNPGSNVMGVLQIQ